MFGFFKKKKTEDSEGTQTPQPSKFPPVPEWKPSIELPIDRIVDRVVFYTNSQKDVAVFKHGTCVLLPDGLSDRDASDVALKVLHQIFHYHPDMQPKPMKDGNILVTYNHPAANVVLSDIAEQHWHEIQKNHLKALATSEVLITPLGPNQFDDFGKKALFGRCFMFMDAQSPEVIKIVRKPT